MNSLFRNKNFKLHWLSGAIAQTGSYITFVALPWLVLALTENNAVLMSTVLAAVALPHGVFILFGGAVVDRFTPYKTIVISRFVFVLVMASLALCVYVNVIPIWLIYVFALLLGTLGAIGIPAGQSMLPFIVDSKNLNSANGIVMATLYIAQILGPIVAGWLMWLGRGAVGSITVNYTGFALAFGVDAVGVLLALILFSAIRIDPIPAQHTSVLRLISQGLRFCWRDKGIRLVLFYLLLVSFFVHGPLIASLPLIAKTILNLSETSFGVLYAMTGLGTIAGAALAILLKPEPLKLGALVLGADFVVGLCLAFLGLSQTFYAAAFFIFLIGVSSGLVMIAGTTWFQLRTPSEYMGRVMSVLMFCVLGTVPVSASLSGYIIEGSSVMSLMVLAGSSVSLITLLGLCIPSVRAMGGIAPLAVTE